MTINGDTWKQSNVAQHVNVTPLMLQCLVTAVSGVVDSSDAHADPVYPCSVGFKSREQAGQGNVSTL